MKKVRFTSILWLLLIPIFTYVKVVWEFDIINEATAIRKPFPIFWLDTSYPYNIIIGIVVITITTYFSFAFINAYINRQVTYTTALFFSSLTLLFFQPNLTSSLIGISLFMNAILLLFSFDEKKKSDFVTYDVGFFIGFALFFEPYLLILTLLLFAFLLILRFSLRQVLQYWAGVLTLPLFIFPMLYFSNTLADWQRYFTEFPFSFSLSIVLDTLDYILLGTLLLFCMLQTIISYKRMKKPSEHLIINFTVVYLLISLCIGLFFYTTPNAYILFIVPGISILYSLSRTENQQTPFLITLLSLLYFLIKTELLSSIFL